MKNSKQMSREEQAVASLFRKVQYYIMAFKELAQFDKKTMDFAEETKREISGLQESWERWAKSKKQHPDIVDMFKWEAVCYRLELVLLHKYGLKTYHKERALGELKKGKSVGKVAAIISIMQ